MTLDIGLTDIEYRAAVLQIYLARIKLHISIKKADRIWLCLPCLYSSCKTLRTLKTTGCSPVLQQTCNLYISGLYLLPFWKQNCTQHYLQSCSFDCLTAIRTITNCAEIPAQSPAYSGTAWCITTLQLPPDWEKLSCGKGQPQVFLNLQFL